MRITMALIANEEATSMGLELCVKSIIIVKASPIAAALSSLVTSPRAIII